MYGCVCHPCQVLVVSMYRFKNCPLRSQTPFFHPTKVSECVDALFIWQRNTGKSKRVNMASLSSALSGHFLCNIDFRAPHRFFAPVRKSFSDEINQAFGTVGQNIPLLLQEKSSFHTALGES